MSDQRWNQIRQRAHELWEREGRPEGRHAEHWREAEQSLQAESSRMATSVGSIGSNRDHRGENAMSDGASENAKLLDSYSEPINRAASVSARILDSDGQPLPRTRTASEDLAIQLRRAIQR